MNPTDFRRLASVVAGGFLSAALLSSAPAIAGDPPKSCPRSKARPANPHGSVLLPVAPAPAPSLLSDEILPVEEPEKKLRREKRRSQTEDRRD